MTIQAVASIDASIGSKDLQSLGQPEALWRHFAALSSIPRPSKKEEAVLAHIIAFAEAKGLERQQDAAGNVLIRRPGSGGGEKAEPVLLQGHVDMVCEKNAATAHDFEKDPIRLRVENDWLRATGTTLGADNGVGVAATMAVLELGPEASLPPIEALFTVDEETGLNGARGMDSAAFSVSAKRMLNLDTEEFGSLYIGCAGGGGSEMEIPGKKSACEGDLLKVAVTGLLGGHSGLNIHEGRGNAVLMATSVAAAALAKVPEARLVEVRGGDKHNAIPREATAAVAVPPAAAAAALAAATAAAEVLKVEYGTLETKMEIEVKPEAGGAKEAYEAADGRRILAALRALPHGVIKMSHAVEGLVETSNNVASVDPLEQGGVKVVLSTRSSLAGALELARDKLESVALLAGAKFSRGDTFPGWNPAPKAPLLALAKEKLAKVSGTEPKVLAIHAGLECGLLLEKCPAVKQCISFGPTIVGAHSPDEALEISTVMPFFQALLDILEELAKVEGPQN